MAVALLDRCTSTSDTLTSGLPTALVKPMRRRRGGSQPFLSVSPSLSSLSDPNRVSGCILSLALRIG